MKETVKFAALADFHEAMFPDKAEEMLDQFIEAVKREKVDFVVDLGDFAFPLPANDIPVENSKKLIDKFNSAFDVPLYHVLGNHECDYFTKEESLKFHGFGTEGTYYSFDFEPFHFVVLDANFMKLEEGYVAYENRNYYKHSYKKPPVIPYIPDYELSWLKEDLAKTKYPTVLFSHQHLVNDVFGFGIQNYDELKEVMDSAPSKVVLSINGHEHVDFAHKYDGRWFYSLMSGTNMFMGTKHPSKGKYTEEYMKSLPCIHQVAPYSKTQYGIFTLDEKGARVAKTEGEFVGKSPLEWGYPEGERFLPYVTEKYFEF